MEKQTIKIATLTAFVTYAFNLHSAAFDQNDTPQHLGSSLTSRMTRTYIRDLLSVEKYRPAFASQEAFERAGLVLPPLSIEQMLPDIAQEHKLYHLREWQELIAKAAEIEHNEPGISFEAIVEKLQYPFSQKKYARIMTQHQHFHVFSLKTLLTALFRLPKQPAWLQPFFSGGFSVRDLRNNNILQNYIIKFYQEKQEPNQSPMAASFYFSNRSNMMINDLIGIQDIPDAEKITRLDLLYNRITYVDAGAFRTFENLKHLSLEGNRIASLNPKAFVGLESLTTLDLSFNLLTTIPAGAFSHLPHLEKLRLKDNKIPESEHARIQAEIPNVVIEW